MNIETKRTELNKYIYSQGDGERGRERVFFINSLDQVYCIHGFLFVRAQGIMYCINSSNI